MRLTVFTTAHPLDDVRVASKFVHSFIDRGINIKWIGPDIHQVASSQSRIAGVDYRARTMKRGKVGRLLALPQSLFDVLSIRGSDWVYVPDPDAILLVSALKFAHGAKIIFDVHEEYHGELLNRWVGERAGKVVAKVLVGAVRKATRSIDILSGVNVPVLAPYATESVPNVILRNSAPAWFSKSSPYLKNSTSPLRIFHGKALGNNGTPTILRALSQFEGGIQVVMMPGPGPVGGPLYLPELHELVAEAGAESFLDFVPSVRHQEMPDLMDSCHVGMIGYGRELGRASLPNRLFEYMARGLPIFAPTYSPLIRDIIEEHNIGIVRDFEDAGSVHDGLDWFANNREEALDMGDRARKVFLNEYSWEADFERLYMLMN